MSLNFEKIVDTAFEETDGQNNFARVNLTMSDAIACIRPYALSVLSYTLFVKCLAKVPRYADLAVNGSNECSDGEIDKGRWSFMLTSADLTEETTFKGDEHNTNKNIRILLKNHMFFRFEVPVGKNYVYIYTYNRYPILSGLFWEQHETDLKGTFSPPITPKIITVLSSMKSYKNALSRLCKPLHNKMRSFEGWETILQVENRVKDAFCKSFLGELIGGTSEAVKSHFKTFDESKMSYDDYVLYVWTTANDLPPYDGINITTDFLLNLRLPEKYIKKLKKEISSESRLDKSSVSTAQDNEVKLISSGVNSTPDNQKNIITTGVNSTPQNESSGVNSTPIMAVTGVNSTPVNETKNTVKTMNDNDLQRKGDLHQRIIHNRIKDNIKKREMVSSNFDDLETIENKLNNENLPEPKQDEKSYNHDMNEIQKDMALTLEQCAELANTIPEFTVRTKFHKPKVVKVLDSDEIEKKTLVNLASIGKRMEKQSKKAESTIISNSSKFLNMFRKIVKEQIPAASFTFSPEIDINDKRIAQMVIDKLRAREALNEDVLIEWMRFTASVNSKRKGYIGVSSMLSALPAFEKYIPAPDMILKRNAQKNTPVAKKKAVIANSMQNLFKDGFISKRVVMSCQLWGIPMTAQYIDSKQKNCAENMILGILKTCTIPEIKGAIGITLKYESITSHMILSDWKDKLGEVIKNVGKLDNFSMTDSDKENAEEFALMFGGING